MKKNTAHQLARLYTADNIDQLPWPKNQQGQFARSYLTPLVKNGLNHYITNIRSSMGVVLIDDHVLPIVITSNEHYNDSYVCSPYGHFIALGLKMLFLINTPWKRKIIEQTLVKCGKLLLKNNFNQVVYVNNWLFSTDLCSDNLSSDQIAAITKVLSDNYPKHAIIFRSLNKKTTPQLQQALVANRFDLIASRQIYLTDVSDSTLQTTRIIKSDERLWQNKKFTLVTHDQISQEDMDQILNLYHQISIVHHSALNPQISKEFISLLFEQNLLSFQILKDQNKVAGAVGYLQRDGVFFCPVFGYDRSHPEHTQIYRLLSTLLFKQASATSSVFHQSAGASKFKTIRRAQGHIEYLGIYHRHLNTRQKFVWKTVKQVMNTVGVAIMRRY